jgi:hypothetical protein
MAAMPRGEEVSARAAPNARESGDHRETLRPHHKEGAIQGESRFFQ